MSAILLENSTVHDITSNTILFSSFDTNLTIIDLNVTNINTRAQGRFLKVSFGSNISIQNIIYKNSSMKFIETLNSDLFLNNIEVGNITLTQHFIDFTSCYNVTVQNLVIHNVSTTNQLIHISESEINLLENMTIHTINSTALYLLKSSVSIINNINIYNVEK